ncbi:MAG: hypothetical protein LN589_05870, partial [Rickettsia endosymbiont of Eriopis connexa]|nr:hypothetical protein [Rickettsia endosymbiont of Eriopis connexa]
ELPKKRNKKNPLTKKDKANNRRLAIERVLNENVISMLKRFKIISDKIFIKSFYIVVWKYFSCSCTYVIRNIVAFFIKKF